MYSRVFYTLTDVYWYMYLYYPVMAYLGDYTLFYHTVSIFILLFLALLSYVGANVTSMILVNAFCNMPVYPLPYILAKSCISPAIG